jgi:hypothetical protein
MGGYSEIVDNLKAIGLKKTIVVRPDTSHGKLIFRHANIATTWGGSSAGRASRSQCEGREFEPPPLHQKLAL